LANATLTVPEAVVTTFPYASSIEACILTGVLTLTVLCGCYVTSCCAAAAGVTVIALRRLANASDALELSQEVFLHVLRRIGQLREPERFAGWLRQVAVRMAINWATRRVAPPTVKSGSARGPSPSRRAA
jgi:hypothetical protein